MSTRTSSVKNISVNLSDQEWKNKLTDTQYKVLRLKGTEPRGVSVNKGGWDDHYEKGVYLCSGCDAEVYTSEMKFDCGCGWPGFWTNVEGAVYEETDKDGRRCELMCAKCGGHLGHVFRNEGFRNPPPNERHCINGTALSFKNEKGEVKRSSYEGMVYL